MHVLHADPVHSTGDVQTALDRVDAARAERLLSTSEALIASSTVIVASTFGIERFSERTLRLRELLLGRAGVSLQAIAATPEQAAAARAAANAPRPPRFRRRRASGNPSALRAV